MNTGKLQYPIHTNGQVVKTKTKLTNNGANRQMTLMDLKYNYKTIYPNTKEYTFFRAL